MSYLTFHSKKIFYKEAGHGKPLVMLHGDTASSVMFEFLLPLYQEHFRVILLDFLGNGQSDRVSLFPQISGVRRPSRSLRLLSICISEK